MRLRNFPSYVLLTGCCALACGLPGLDEGGGTGARLDAACTEPEPETDRCQACACEDGDWICRATPCPPPPVECQPGDPEPDQDPCTSCSCEDGLWKCILTACPPPDCEPGDVYPHEGPCESCACEDETWVCRDTPCALGSCLDEADCIISGCNSEVCGAESVATPCVALPEFQCYVDAECGCIDGQCAWAPEVQACLDNF